MLTPRISLALAVFPVFFACSGGSDNKPPSTINTPPQLTSDASVAVTENQRGDFFSLSGSDADGDALRFAVSGADAQHFAIDANTGALRFRQPVNYEQPADANGDNIYELTAVVEDSRGTRQSNALTVEVTNVEFAYEFLSPLPDTIVERERYSRLPIALWMEYDYPEPVLVLCDGEILNPASDSRMTWTGSIQLGLGRVNVNCVFRRGEQEIETHTIPVRHQYVISDNRYLVYDALNDQFMIPHPQRLETLLIDADSGDAQKRYPWIGVVPALQDVVADANIGGALYTAEGAVQRLAASGNSIVSVTGRLDSDIPAQVQSTLSYDAANNRLYASGRGNTYSQIDLASAAVTDSSYLGTLAKPPGSRTEIAWDATDNRLFFASGAGTGVEAVTPGGDLVASYAFNQPQRWGEIQYEPTRDQVFISATSENAVLRLDLASGNYTSLGGDGPALNTPLTLALDETRDRLATISGHQLLAVDPDSGARTALFDSAVGEGATPTGFAGIWVAADSTHALAMDRQLGRFYRIDLRTGVKAEHAYTWRNRKGAANNAAQSADFLSAKDFQVEKAKFNADGNVAALHLRSRDIGEPENYLDLLALKPGNSQRITTNADIVDFSFSQPEDQLMVLLRNGDEYSVSTYALIDGSRVANEVLAIAVDFRPMALQAVDGELYVLGRGRENAAPVFRLLVKNDGTFTTLTTFSDLGRGDDHSAQTSPVIGINTMYDGTVLALLLPEQTPQFWERAANQTYEMGFSEFGGTDQPQDFYTIDDYEELYFFRTRAGLHLCWRFHCAIQAN